MEDQVFEYTDFTGPTMGLEYVQFLFYMGVLGTNTPSILRGSIVELCVFNPFCQSVFSLENLIHLRLN